MNGKIQKDDVVISFESSTRARLLGAKRPFLYIVIAVNGLTADLMSIDDGDGFGTFHYKARRTVLEKVGHFDGEKILLDRSLDF